nr:hypothetical protein [Tanacetum cinerariifolium]
MIKMIMMMIKILIMMVMTLYIPSYLFLKKKLKMRKDLIPSFKHQKTQMMNDASLGLNVGSEEGHNAEDDDDGLYKDDDGSRCIDSLFETTPRVDVQASTTVVPLTLIAPTLPPPTIPTISQVPQAPTPPTTAPSTSL